MPFEINDFRLTNIKKNWLSNWFCMLIWQWVSVRLESLMKHECRIQVKVCAEINVIYEQLATSGPRPATGTEPLPGALLVPVELFGHIPMWISLVKNFVTERISLYTLSPSFGALVWVSLTEQMKQNAMVANKQGNTTCEYASRCRTFIFLVVMERTPPREHSLLKIHAPTQHLSARPQHADIVTRYGRLIRSRRRRCYRSNSS